MYILKPVRESSLGHFLVDEREYRRYDRCHTDKEGDIGRLGVSEGSILGKEVERSARYSEEQEEEFIRKRITPKPDSSLVFRQSEKPDSRICEGETDSEYRSRIHSGRNQRLRAYECYAPNSDHEKGQQMMLDFGRSHLSNSLERR